MKIPRLVWILSFVSLFTDMASEMLYPIMPVYLRSIGFSIVGIGLLEGIAEAVAGLSKGYFGKLSDQSGKRAPFIQWGYGLSALSKPMMAIFTFPLWIFGARTLDRLGKGLRTGARDAMLSSEATPQTKGKIFGFHRSMDTLGAVLGPALALIFLYYKPGEYKLLFLIAFVPGVLAILATLLLKDKSTTPKPPQKIHFFSFLNYWKQSPAAYRKVVAGFLVFALFNSSDLFLLLRAKESGLSDTQVIMLYIGYNLFYAIAAFPLGNLADKIGLNKMFIAGTVIFAIVYFLMGLAPSLPFMIGIFLLYALYAAATEGITKAWISNLVPPTETATAIGTYSGFQSICALVASSLAGLLWYQFGAQAAFFSTALVAIAVAIYFIALPKNLNPTHH